MDYPGRYLRRLKIPTGQSEAVNRTRTDNTMTKSKRTHNYLQNTTQKTKDRLYNMKNKSGERTMTYNLTEN